VNLAKNVNRQTDLMNREFGKEGDLMDQFLCKIGNSTNQFFGKTLISPKLIQHQSTSVKYYI